MATAMSALVCVDDGDGDGFVGLAAARASAGDGFVGLAGDGFVGLVAASALAVATARRR